MESSIGRLFLTTRVLSRRRGLPQGAMALAGLSCLVLAQPRLARAQAEELPPELAAKPDVPPPSQTPQGSNQATSAPHSAPMPAPNHAPTILFVPYLGFSLPAGDRWAGYEASPRFGALLGWQATERLSLNGECDVDYVRSNPDPPPPLVDRPRRSFWDGFWAPPRHYIDLTLSPLVNLRAGQIRLGPKIGWFSSRGFDDWGQATGSGLLVGFNAGLFLPYRGASVGGLLTGTFRVFTSSVEPAGGHHTVGLVAAVLL
jgi:hypothetical protein